MTARRRAMTALACAAASVLGAPVAAEPGKVIRVEHYDPSTIPSRGPVAAPVTVELFFAPSINGALRMPAYRHLEALAQAHPTRLRILYRVVRRGAQPPGPQLPTLALEAWAQGRFFEFVREVHSQRTTMTREQMLDLARRVGLDPVRAERAITDDRYGEVLTENERRLERLGGSASPSVFFNGRSPRSSLSSMTEGDYAAAYQDAYQRALDLLDRGVEQRDLMRAFESQRTDTQPRIVTAKVEDDAVVESFEHALADPPLDLRGLPSYGDPAAQAALPIIVLCRPNDSGCMPLLRVIRNLHGIYRGDVRILWAPWFRVDREDAAELTLLGDAALCAEQVGSNADDLDASPGFSWITEAYTQLARLHGRRLVPDRLIDSISTKLRIDPQALSACRARISSLTLEWIEAARRAGVETSPAIVIGGRIYHALSDSGAIQRLIEAELAPGVLGRCTTTGC